MTFAANTWITVAAVGVTEDDHGDPVVATEPVGATRYKASIVEKRRTVYDETSGTLRTIRYAVGRVTPGRPLIDENTTIWDKRTGKVWVVDELIDTSHTFAGTSDVMVILRETSGS